MPAPTTQHPVLLVDARNCMYRAIYASKRQRPNRPSVHAFTIMLRMISRWVRHYRPSMIQVFWDAPRETIWRRRILETYKDRDNNGYIADLVDDLIVTERVAREFMRFLNVYQFYRKEMEADDLIYAACKLQCGRPMVISSTDSDMLQIPYSMSGVRVFNAEKGVELDPPDCNPVMIKALAGERADVIGGYSGIGPKTAAKFSASPKLLHEHLAKADRSIFIRNLLLVDLALCPSLLDNILYISKTLAERPVFDKSEQLALERKHKIAGISTEYTDVVAPFRYIPNE